MQSTAMQQDFIPVQKNNINGTLRSELVRDYSPLVGFIARKIAARLPASVDIDDLISTGYIGLLEAIDKYDPSMDNKFKTYGEWRIRGAILDELRNMDLVPRSVRDKIKHQQRVENQLTQELGRRPSTKEISKALGYSTENYHKFLKDHFSPVEISMTRMGESSDDSYVAEPLDLSTCITVEDSMIGNENCKQLKEIIATLPKQQSLVLNLYYFYEFNLKQCAYVMDLSESRISQIRSHALKRLEKKLESMKFSMSND